MAGNEVANQSECTEKSKAIQQMEVAQKAYLSRRQVLRKSGKSFLTIGTIGAAAFLGLSRPGVMPQETAKAACCGVFSCSGGCYAGCTGCTLGCKGTCYSFCASLTN